MLGIGIFRNAWYGGGADFRFAYARKGDACADGDALSHRCPRMDSILEQINRECARLTGEMLRNNRTEIFAMDYESAANIINEALEEDDGEYRYDTELERKVI